jgi:hypothetical protein
MKANETPEKIYLFENPISCTPDDRWLSKRSDENDIEYIRTDAFIEKDLALTIEDIKTIDRLLNKYVDYSNPYQEVLNQFNKQKGE